MKTMTVTGLQLQFDCFNENNKTAEAYRVMQQINNLLHEHMGDTQPQLFFNHITSGDIEEWEEIPD